MHYKDGLPVMNARYWAGAVAMVLLSCGCGAPHALAQRAPANGIAAAESGDPAFPDLYEAGPLGGRGQYGVGGDTVPQPTPEQRAAALVARMTLDEKLSQLGNNADAIGRLGVPKYGWWNEALHGVAWAGVATVFPTPIAWGATFDPQLIREVGAAVSAEARAKHSFQLNATGSNSSATFYGLTFYAPNINLFRDPRWGRGLETPGEDPTLTAAIGRSYIAGLQRGSSVENVSTPFLRVAATAKHFAAYSLDRMPPRLSFDPDVTTVDLMQTYTVATRAAVEEGVASVMCAYSGVNGSPSCASHELEQLLLRDTFGFQGFVVSDCGAIEFLQTKHHVAATIEEAVGFAMTNGTDMDCGPAYTQHAAGALQQGLITEDDIDRSVTRSLSARFSLGMFDKPSTVPWNSIPISVVNSDQHRVLARRVAAESLVLLKNNGSALPFDAGIRRVAVIGPNANSTWALMGNYYGCTNGPTDYNINSSCTLTTVLGGIAERPGTETVYARGCDIATNDTRGFAAAVDAANAADAVVVVLGLRTCTPPGPPGEQHECVESEGHDRDSLGLPGVQQQLLRAITASIGASKKLVVVLLNGGAVSIGWASAAPDVDAILEAWYPGQEGGVAVADALWGDGTAPAGRLPVTVYSSTAQLPPETSMSMDAAPFGRSHRYFTGEPLFAFGYGLSYAKFSYLNATVTPSHVLASPGAQFRVNVTVQRTGSVSADEVTMVFARYTGPGGANTSFPLQQLVGFTRTAAATFADTCALPVIRCQQQSTTVSIVVNVAELQLVGVDGALRVQQGAYKLWVGGRAPGSAGSGTSSAGPSSPLELSLVVE